MEHVENLVSKCQCIGYKLSIFLFCPVNRGSQAKLESFLTNLTGKSKLCVGDSLHRKLHKNMADLISVSSHKL